MNTSLTIQKSDPGYVIKQCPRMMMYKDWHQYNNFLCVECAVKIESESVAQTRIAN